VFWLQVRVIYVRNLLLTTTEETLEQLFNAKSDNGVERVKKMKDYAFIHFCTREQAEAAKDALDNTSIDGNEVEISWAKPVDRSSYKVKKLMTKSGKFNGNRTMMDFPNRGGFGNQYNQMQPRPNSNNCQTLAPIKAQLWGNDISRNRNNSGPGGGMNNNFIFPPNPSSRPPLLPNPPFNLGNQFEIPLPMPHPSYPQNCYNSVAAQNCAGAAASMYHMMPQGPTPGDILPYYSHMMPPMTEQAGNNGMNGYTPHTPLFGDNYSNSIFFTGHPVY